MFWVFYNSISRVLKLESINFLIHEIIQWYTPIQFPPGNSISQDIVIFNGLNFPFLKTNLHDEVDKSAIKIM